MQLAHPGNVWWLALVALVVAFGVLALVRRAQTLRRLRLAGVHAGRHSLARFSTRTLALGLLGLATLGPCWGEEEAPLPPARGRDLLIALDVSRSMLAEDMSPNRLEYARRQLQLLGQDLEQRGGYRIGLLAFADRPVLLCPLTTDFRHFQEELKNARLLSVRLREGGLPSAHGTQLARALERMLDLLPSCQGQAEQAVGGQDVLVVSDGGDDATRDLDGVLAAFNERHVAVHTLGVGDPSRAVPIPVSSPTGLRVVLQHEGRVVQTKLEEATLRQAAERTGGLCLTARPDAAAMDRLQAALAAKEQRELDSAARATIRLHRFAWFLVPAILLLCLENLIPATVRHAVRVRGGLAGSHWLARLVPPSRSKNSEATFASKA